jgi:Insertion element 4 transposase N-terminal
VQLKEFALINPKLEAKEVFQAIQTAMPTATRSVIAPEAIDQALEKSARFEKRQRKLPASLVVCLVIAMSWWSSDSMATVLKNLVNGLNRQWTKLGQYSIAPNSSSMVEVRIVEYSIETEGELKTYRLITSLMDLALFPALLLAQQYHQRWEARKYH